MEWSGMRGSVLNKKVVYNICKLTMLGVKRGKQKRAKLHNEEGVVWG
jgi:hypothetical protein